jgi:hypothetical protein
MTDAERWQKTCRCGEVWSAEHWPELPLVGRYSAGRDGWIEVRSCVCAATLVVPVSEIERPAGAAPTN